MARDDDDKNNDEDDMMKKKDDDDDQPERSKRKQQRNHRNHHKATKEKDCQKAKSYPKSITTTIPGQQGCHMMQTFGDGKFPAPAVEAALLGAAS
jgi:hypothetical protein